MSIGLTATGPILTSTCPGAGSGLGKSPYWIVFGGAGRFDVGALSSKSSAMAGRPLLAATLPLGPEAGKRRTASDSARTALRRTPPFRSGSVGFDDFSERRFPDEPIPLRATVGSSSRVLRGRRRGAGTTSTRCDRKARSMRIRGSAVLTLALLSGIAAGTSFAQYQPVVPGSGVKITKVGDDFKDPEWSFVHNYPKASHEMDEKVRVPVGLLDQSALDGKRQAGPSRLHRPRGNAPGRNSWKPGAGCRR